MSTTAANYNAKVIVEFRASEGRLGGIWEGMPPLLVHHIGARLGVSRVNPVGYLPDEPRYQERERLFARGAHRLPDLANYARKTDRVIPLIVLTPRGDA